MTTYDRSFSTNNTSSVIDEVFYNSDTKELYVKLTRQSWYGDPVIAGYEDVPEDVYSAFELENTNKLAGKTGSVGAYWNSWIKPFFRGLTTDGVELVSAKQPGDATPPIEEVVDEAFVFEGVSEAEAVNEGELVFFTVLFDSESAEGEFALYATDLADAVSRFEKIAEIAGLAEAEVLTATAHLA